MLKIFENSNAKKKAGFTLVEMLVSLAIFSIIVSAFLGIFTSFIKSQRRILAEKQLVDQTSYFIERFSRITMMAQKDVSGTCIAANRNYGTTTISGIMYFAFLDANSKCHMFFLESGTIKEQESATNNNYDFSSDPASPYSPLRLFSPNFTVTSFKITGAGWQQIDFIQPSVTIFFEASGKDNIKIKSQTTISQRNGDVAF
jgi:prepilin-type N-terminal cleavage/methylation domain-containing protein